MCMLNFLTHDCIVEVEAYIRFLKYMNRINAVELTASNTILKPISQTFEKWRKEENAQYKCLKVISRRSLVSRVLLSFSLLYEEKLYEFLYEKITVWTLYMTSYSLFMNTFCIYWYLRNDFVCSFESMGLWNSNSDKMCDSILDFLNFF